MSTSRISVFYLCLAVLCIFSGYSSPENAEKHSETSTLRQSSSTDPPTEPSSSDSSPSNKQTSNENVVDKSQKVEGEATKQEKMVVAFVPDYPSK